MSLAPGPSKGVHIFDSDQGCRNRARSLLEDFQKEHTRGFLISDKCSPAVSTLYSGRGFDSKGTVCQWNHREILLSSLWLRLCRAMVVDEHLDTMPKT